MATEIILQTDQTGANTAISSDNSVIFNFTITSVSLLYEGKFSMKRGVSSTNGITATIYNSSGHSIASVFIAASGFSQSFMDMNFLFGDFVLIAGNYSLVLSTTSLSGGNTSYFIKSGSFQVINKGNSYSISSNIIASSITIPKLSVKHRISAAVKLLGTVNSSVRTKHPIAVKLIANSVVAPNANIKHYTFISLRSNSNVTSSIKNRHEISFTFKTNGTITSNAKITHLIFSTVRSLSTTTSSIKIKHLVVINLRSDGITISTAKCRYSIVANLKSSSIAALFIRSKHRIIVSLRSSNDMVLSAKVNYGNCTNIRSNSSLIAYAKVNHAISARAQSIGIATLFGSMRHSVSSAMQSVSTLNGWNKVGKIIIGRLQSSSITWFKPAIAYAVLASMEFSPTVRALAEIVPCKYASHKISAILQSSGSLIANQTIDIYTRKGCFGVVCQGIDSKEMAQWQTVNGAILPALTICKQRLNTEYALPKWCYIYSLKRPKDCRYRE